MRAFATLTLVAFAASPITAADPPAPKPLEPALRERCEKILRDGLKSDEFWPAMHAAEALTLAGHGKEVLDSLAKRSETDDQKRCGLAREAVRAGDRSELAILFEILDKPGSNGHTHAAESLFKLAEVSDGKKLRAALARNDNIRLKLMAAAALARCGHATALEAVRKRVTDSDMELRKVAAWVLGQLGAKSDVDSLRAQHGKETDPVAKAYFVHALALLGDAEGRKALGANLTSSDAAVKTYSAEFAGHCGANEFRDALVKLLDDTTLDVRVRAAQSLIVLSQPAVNANEVITNDVYQATDQNPRYSEGSVAVLKNGTLLYATTEFTGGAADASKARVVARASRDGGRTWGEARVLQENVGKQNVMSVTLRRLKPGAADGALGLFYLVKNGPADLKLYLRVSTDEAKTFGTPVCVTDAPGYHVVNNDRVTVLSTGRIIVPVAWDDDISQKGGMHFECFCYFSDDAGKTWKRGKGSVDLPKRGAMEPEVIELSDGKLLLIIRTQLGHIATARSRDGGEHWDEPGQLPLKAPESPATIRRIPATGDLLLVWNNTHDPKAGHGGNRTPLTAAISSDDGKTWKNIRDLEAGKERTYAYTSIAFVKDRVVLTYYITDAKDKRWSSRFRSLPVRWFYEEARGGDAPQPDGKAPGAAYPFAFKDVGDEAGLFPAVAGIRGHGAAWGDADDDGWLDLYVGTFQGGGSRANLFFRNDKGKFKLDDQKALEFPGRVTGIIFADLDNDGDLDLYVASMPQPKNNLAGCTLFRNDKGKFTDISKDSGACPTAFGGRGVTVLDYDGDGLLDLLVGEDPIPGYNGSTTKSTRLFRNKGNLQFEDVSRAVGLPEGIPGLGVAAADVNNDGWPDFFLASSGGGNVLFLNDGKGKFTEAAGSRKVFEWKGAGGDNMICGVCFCDVNRDGLLDVVLGPHYATPWIDPIPVRLYLNRGIKNGVPTYEDVTEKVGLAPLGMKAPHVEIQDFDNDGWPDIYASTVKFADKKPYPVIFRHQGVKEGLPRFRDDAWAVNDFPTGEDKAIKRSGTMFDKVIKVKKIIYMAPGPSGDFDNDGRLDLFLPNWWVEGRSLLLRNETQGGNWLRVKVEGSDGVNRMGIGSKVKVYAAGKLGDASALHGCRDIATGYGYASGQPAYAHFGLGKAESVDVEVILPHGKGTLTRKGVKANQLLTVKR